MSAGKEQVHKMQLRKSYRNVWHTDLMSTMAADTPCIHAVVDICPVVGSVENVNALHFAFAQRSSAALEIL
ncbi:hypothetical protein E3N88_44781 [Mikania micrantha]|nr:hypothetical protein E3N88_44781 [Mikania micrantha]